MPLLPAGLFTVRVYAQSSQRKKASKKTKKPAAPKPPAAKNVGAAGLISLAQHELNLGNFAVAAQYAAAASSKAPLLNDYAQYVRAQAEYKQKNYSEVSNSVTQVFNQQPISPLTGAAAALAVNADLDGDQPKQALELVKKYFDRIPQPQANYLFARCFEGNGDLAQAAEYYQRVYYNNPGTQEARDSAVALAAIKLKLGDAYPPPMPTAMLGRAEKLIQAKRPADARIELTAAIPELGGAQRDLARVRLGEVDFFANDARAAFEYLTALKVDDAEADAERIAYLIRCTRKLDRDADVKPFLAQLEQQHPNSTWRLDSLVAVADQARAQNDTNTYLPLYKTCAATFGRNPRAATCAWRVAFDSYKSDSGDASDLLRYYVQQFPESEDTTDALYFLGRLSERKNDNAGARACFEELTGRFPNTYFATLAKVRLKQAAIQAQAASLSVQAFMKTVPWTDREHFPSFNPGPLAQKRLSRAQLLQMTGLDEFAEGELKFGARNDGEQPNVYAVQLAKFALARNAPDETLHYIKIYTPGYLYMPLDQAPVEFWQLAFPMPFRASIEQYSRDQNLDPFLVTALIRQESDFNVKELSDANAYGLMQVVPATGRMLARHFGIRRLAPSDLFLASRNIQLGTYYLRTLINQFGGQTEYALAAYNAGPGRPEKWKTWGEFREPAEFVETIPFRETRLYVQIVLRNADVYRRLYYGTKPDVPAYQPKPAPKTSVKTKRRRS